MFFVVSKIKKRILACLLTATFAIGNMPSGRFLFPKVRASRTSWSVGTIKAPPVITEPGDLPAVRDALSTSISALRKTLNDGGYYVFVDNPDHPLQSRYRSPVVPVCYSFSCKNQSAYTFYKLTKENPLVYNPNRARQQPCSDSANDIWGVVMQLSRGSHVPPSSSEVFGDDNSGDSSSSGERAPGLYHDLVSHDGSLKQYDGSAHYDEFLDQLSPKLELFSNHIPRNLLPPENITNKTAWDSCEARKTLKGLRVVSPYGIDKETGLAKGQATLTVLEYPLVNLSLEAYGEYLKHLVISNPNYTPDELFDHPDVQRKLVQEFGSFYYEPSLTDRASNLGNQFFGEFRNLAAALGNLGNAIPQQRGLHNPRWCEADNGCILIPSIERSERDLRVYNIYSADKIALRFYYSDVASWGARFARKARATAGFAGIATPMVMGGAIFWKLFNWTVSQMGLLLTRGTLVATNEFLRERNKLLNDPVKLRDAIKRMMKQGVVGLTDTIDKLTTLVTGSLALRKCSGLLNKNHCQLIAFIGPPGTGKSLLAQRYAIALTGKPIPNWGYITSASIKPGISPSEQFFNSQSELVQNLKKSNGNTVIFIDEIDKFDSNQLLENLRDAVDKGTIVATSENTEQRPGLASTTTSKVIRTESINVSGLIVIVGTNERPECWGLEPDPDKPEYTVGRTVIERSGSIVQRFQRFKFNPYTVDEYKQMYDNALNAIRPEAVKMFGLHIVFDENLSKELAKESELRLMGGRSVPILLSEMAGAITSYNVNTNPDSLSFMSRIMNKMLPNRNLATLRISFDSASHKFKISEEPTQSRDKSSKTKSESVKRKSEVAAEIKSVRQAA